MRYTVNTSAGPFEFGSVREMKRWLRERATEYLCIDSIMDDDDGTNYSLTWKVSVRESYTALDIDCLGPDAIYVGIPIECVKACSHAGSCDTDVAHYVSMYRDELSKIPTDTVRSILRPSGAWTDDELQDTEENLHRLLWMACGEANENKDNLVYMSAA